MPKKSLRKQRKQSPKKEKKQKNRRGLAAAMRSHDNDNTSPEQLWFEACSDTYPVVEKLTRKQQFYEAYMSVGHCYIKKVIENSGEFMSKLEEVDGIKNSGGRLMQPYSELAVLFLNLIGEHMKYIYISSQALERISGNDFIGNLPYIRPDNEVFLSLYNKKENANSWLFIPKNGFNRSVVSLSLYPEVKNLLKPYLEGYDVVEVEDEKFGTCLEIRNLTNSIPVGKYQEFEMYQPTVLFISHPSSNHIELYAQLGASIFEFFYQNMIMQNENKEVMRRLSFLTYYFFVNTVYYLKGTAGAAKVILNTFLEMIGEKPVREVDRYRNQADWVAFTSVDYQDFLKKVNDGEVFVSL